MVANPPFGIVDGVLIAGREGVRIPGAFKLRAFSRP